MSVQKVSSHAIWKIETFIEQDTRYKKHCTQNNDTTVPFKVGTLGPHTALPIAISCPVIFSWISSTIRNLFPFKSDFSFWKSHKSRAPNLGCRGTESPGWFDALPKKFCTRYGAWVGMLWWSCQSPVVHSCGLLNHPNSFHGGMFTLNSKSNADLLF